MDCTYLIGAPGRAGAEWFSKECEQLGLDLTNNQVDVGVRVEVPAQVFEDITNEVYEAKLVYTTKQYGDRVRTFCMNPNGYVVAENTDGIVTVNGHSFSDPARNSGNTNFALLVSNKFTEPFKEPHRYGKHIASCQICWAAASLSSASGIWSRAAEPMPIVSARVFYDRP